MGIVNIKDQNNIVRGIDCVDGFNRLEGISINYIKNGYSIKYSETDFLFYAHEANETNTPQTIQGIYEEG
jgi:hypothetical protein